MDVLALAKEIIDGRRLTREEDLSFFLTCDLDDLCKGADQIREARIGDKVDLCSIINGRSGRCPEDCKYCAQSAHHHTNCEIYDFLPEEKSRCTFFVSYVGGPWQAAVANIEINSLRKDVVPNYFVLL